MSLTCIFFEYACWMSFRSWAKARLSYPLVENARTNYIFIGWQFHEQWSVDGHGLSTGMNSRFWAGQQWCRAILHETFQKSLCPSITEVSFVKFFVMEISGNLSAFFFNLKNWLGRGRSHQRRVGKFIAKPAINLLLAEPVHSQICLIEAFIKLGPLRWCNQFSDRSTSHTITFDSSANDNA